MSHQRFPQDVIKEPHSISLKVLRLSRPSLVAQYPIKSPEGTQPTAGAGSHPASLAYSSPDGTNPDPFILSPILNLPPSFGSAYVGETFSCTLCANHDVPDGTAARQVRDVRIEAEMKTPGSAGGVVTKLDLGPKDVGGGGGSGGEDGGVDLREGETLQRIVRFDLKEEGNHVLAVTVSYYEATETSGRTRTFRKLYQFICKSSLIVRTKVSPLPGGLGAATACSSSSVGDKEEEKQQQEQQSQLRRRRQWVLEAQLENCSEDAIQLERVVLDLEPGLVYTDCNWDVDERQKPVLHPSEVEQVCFVVQEAGAECEVVDGKIVFGVLGVGWRGEMGSRGFLSTGKLGTRFDG
ncbi:hypothetical protein MCOR25_000606 [Pyricularia grisea]|uniref:DUF974 domain-containing protein n=1 Tax=Pyricularia grisea TaxID=148305 RepID=A0A6P8AUD2_PYRGI|nr:uncharacterized protein PgNI_08136 [Pyricularia grisea]KAI6382604.1 hypothetical protein MCOR25_000606 [Pyricularia grisea]TLD05833.1 hypothetical protein PgNI_08136 [Pyricularia grisea]